MTQDSEFAGLSPTPEPRLPNSPGAPVVRCVMFVVLAFILWVAFQTALFPLGLFWMAALSGFGAGLAANTVMVWRYDALMWSRCGLGWRPGLFRELGLGFGLGAGAATLLLGGALLFGAATLEPAAGGAPSVLNFLGVAALLAFGSAGEELLFRGYGFQALARAKGLPVPLILFSTLFALAHMENLNISMLGLVNTGLWGALLGYAWWRTRALYVPVGIHFGWNLLLPVFGVELSGFTMKVTGYVLTWHVDDLWSGGSYGPEGGLPTTLLVGGLFVATRKLFRPSSN